MKSISKQKTRKGELGHARYNSSICHDQWAILERRIINRE